MPRAHREAPLGTPFDPLNITPPAFSTGVPYTPLNESAIGFPGIAGLPNETEEVANPCGTNQVMCRRVNHPISDKPLNRALHQQFTWHIKSPAIDVNFEMGRANLAAMINFPKINSMKRTAEELKRGRDIYEEDNKLYEMYTSTASPYLNAVTVPQLNYFLAQKQLDQYGSEQFQDVDYLSELLSCYGIPRTPIEGMQYHDLTGTVAMTFQGEYTTRNVFGPDVREGQQLYSILYPQEIKPDAILRYRILHDTAALELTPTSSFAPDFIWQIKQYHGWERPSIKKATEIIKGEMVEGRLFRLGVAYHCTPVKNDRFGFYASSFGHAAIEQEVSFHNDMQAYMLAPPMRIFLDTFGGDRI